MKLSTKGRYAMVAMADIALSAKENLVTLGEISKRQNISMPYLEQLFVKLRRSNLVISVRGPGGGYKLARPSHQIRIVDILTAVEESVDAMRSGCWCFGRPIWFQGSINDKSSLGRIECSCLCLSSSNQIIGRC